MQKCFLTPLVVIVLLCFHANARADENWSEPVNNIRARLSLERDPNSSFPKVFVEFQSVADFMGSIKIRFKPELLALQVTNAKNLPVEKPGLVNYSAIKQNILEALCFVVSVTSASEWAINPPSWRGDIEGRADTVEEVLRVNGYDNIPPVSMTKQNAVTQPGETPNGARSRRARTTLAARGLNECVTW